MTINSPQSEAKFDPYDVDIHRHQLAVTGQSTKLKESYIKGAHAELPELSSTALWDQMPDYHDPPSFRLERLRRVSMRLPNEGIILDVGPGWGEIVPMVTANLRRRYVGLDFSLSMTERLAKKYPDVSFLHGDLSTVHEKFDVIMALEVCEHIAAHKIMDFYRQIIRCLKSDGKLLISVPIYEDLKAATLKCPCCGTWHSRMGHVRRYTPELIKAELEVAGFRVVGSEFVYAHFSTNLTGTLKRFVTDIGRRLLDLGTTAPLNIIVEAVKQES
jgi:cyclopropane fatty-acyl-phospholipid synthase-like methyltransferase